jgi:putative hemolysin
MAFANFSSGCKHRFTQSAHDTRMNPAESTRQLPVVSRYRSRPKRSAPELPPAYSVKLVDNAQEFRAALQLRYEVFNLELREGLQSSYSTGCDFDAFDAVTDHVIVKCAYSRRVIGTYRVQTGAMAARHLGYYSEQEFDFSPYESLRPQVLELGRACIHRDHRSSQVLILLWKAIIQYGLQRGCRYLIGCSSLTSQNPATGLAVYSRLEGFLAPPDLRTTPLPGYRCEACSTDDNDAATEAASVPKLLRAYLTVGARICGAPALDRQFGTIDFLTLLDLARMPKAMFARTAS